MSNYTKVIYLNKLISIKKENNYNSFIASNDIEKHTLLLIEHTFTGSLEQCQHVIQTNEHLFNELHPRIKKWNETENKNDIALKKVLANGFVISDSNSIVIGDTISKFNHSCSSNCAHFHAGQTKINNLMTNYLAIITIGDIKNGEELTINYGNDRGHIGSDDFKCLCGKTDAERQETQNILESISLYYQKNNIMSIKKNIIDKYESISKNIMAFQYLAKIGLVVANDSYLSMSTQFQLIVDNVYKEGTPDEKKDKMIDYVNHLFS